MKTIITVELKNELQNKVSTIANQHKATIDEMFANRQITIGQWFKLMDVINNKWFELSNMIFNAWYNSKEMNINPDWIEDSIRLCIEV